MNKFLYIIAFIAILIGSYFIINSQNKVLQETTENTEISSTVTEIDKDKESSYDYNSNTYQLTDNFCNLEKCIFTKNTDDIETDQTPIGIGTFEGYYTQYNKLDWGDVPVVCDALTVINGPKEFTDDFINKVNSGNAINKINELGQLVFNIPLFSLSSEDRQKIKNSSINNPVKISILYPTRVGRGVPACFSFAEKIINVK